MSLKRKALLSKLPENTDLTEITTVVITLCLGDPRDPEDGCHERFNIGISGLVPRKTLIIQTGGTVALPLCDLMFEIIKRKRPNWSTQFMSICLGWGTRSEIANAFSIIRTLSNHYIEGGIDTRRVSGFKVIIASNKAHLRRIKWYVKVHNISFMNVEYREAKHEFGAKNTLREWIGTELIKIKDLFLGRENLIRLQDQRFEESFK